MNVQGKRVLIVGLARSGLAAAFCLRRRDAVVTVTDLKPPSAFQAIIPELAAQKIGMELGLQREETFLAQELIIVSPGVPWDLPHLRAAREKGIPVFPEIEVASWYLPAGRIVGVTGTNGKSTTTSLLGKILEASGLTTWVGGNIGVPLTSLVDQVTPESWVVAELSSYQLEALRDFRPHVAVLLNVTSHHTDRHASFESYVGAKARIFLNQGVEDYAILNADDPTVPSLVPEIKARKVFFSRRQNLPDGVMVSNGQVLYRHHHLERVLLRTREIPLKGDFNIDNVMAAAAAACVIGADFEAVRQALREFKGLPHRLEFVREIRGIGFYNDSKATSVDAASKAIEAFSEGLHVILGGKDEGASFEPLRRWVQRTRGAYLIGAAADRLAKELSGIVVLTEAGDLETATRKAFERARPGEAVLLAPACPSFDQFRDFEHRGQMFKEIVERLAAESTASESRTSGLGSRESESGNRKPSSLIEQRAPGPTESHLEAGSGSLSESVAQPRTVATIPHQPSIGLNDRASETVDRGDAEVRVAGPESRAPELIYVYEVSAEEVDPDVDLEAGAQEEKFEVIDPDKMNVVEDLDDEPLPFEVRVGETRKTNSKRGTGRKPLRGQSRLPGI